MKQLKQEGFSLMETIVTIMILGIISYGIFKTLGHSFKEVKTSNQEKTTNDIQLELINTITTQASFSQVDYRSESSVSILSNDLPMAWSTEGLRSPINQCGNSCPPGRYGYVIKPITGSKGLYKLTLKITHPSWAQEKFYEMLIGE